MQARGPLLAGLLSLLSCAATAGAGTLVYSHVGDADPTVESWTLQVGNAARGALADDEGLAAWFVNDASGALSPTFYTQSTAPHTAAAADGWTLRATLRVDADTDTPDCAIFIESSVGGRRFFLSFGSNAGQTFYLRNACIGGGLAADAPGSPPTAYHTYEVAWDPDKGSTGEADIFIDGLRQAAASGWPGTATASLERVVFGANDQAGQGQGNYHRVEWEVGEQACRDGIDNDGDGTTDHAGGTGDPGCESATDPSEKKPDLVCDDGLDNDMDGLVDTADPGCSSPFDDSEIIKGPALFSGTLVTEQGFPSSPQPSVVLSATGSLTVIRSNPATFTVPSNVFVGTSSTTTLVNSTYFYFSRVFLHYQMAAGYFSPSYLTPGTTLESAGLRLKVGPNGFGGEMDFIVASTSRGMRLLDAGVNGELVFSRARYARFGSSSFGDTRSDVISGTAVGTLFIIGSLSQTTSYTTTGVTRRAPWITGTVTATTSINGIFTSRTAMGSDLRNTAGTSGTLSLVTPHLTTFSGPRFSRGVALTSKLTLDFSPAPEPARLALLASGLLGLFTLSRLRSR